jgi:cytochrome P450
LRPLFAEARALSPVLVAGDLALVTSFAEVTEVLKSPAFTVSEIYGPRMERTTGAFFLAMDAGPQYDREAALARRAVRPGDIATVRAIARSTAMELVERARATGAIDAVAEFSRLVPLRIVQRFFGVPGPNDVDLARWLRTIFWDIFLNQRNDASVVADAVASGQELAAYLSALIQARQAERASGTLGDDYLSRLVAQQGEGDGFDDDGIRRTVGGIIVGAVDTQSKAIAQALVQILERPTAVQIARDAARAGDDALLASCVQEALRFDPMNPILPRFCGVETVLAQGTRREKVIPRGATVYVATLGAMFDADEVDDPHEFRPGRPAGDYLHFGLGLHRCFGERFNDVVLPEAIKAIVTLPGVRLDGPMKFDGPFPAHLPLRFDA